MPPARYQIRASHGDARGDLETDIGVGITDVTVSIAR